MSEVFLIAEIAQAHEGSLGIAHSYIDALAACGVNAIKFQTHIAEAESSKHEMFRVNFSYEDKTRFDYWKRMEFTKEQWLGIADHCNEKRVEFISSPFSCAAVDLLESLNVKRYKIGSGELQNNLMLDKIARTCKPIILSSGMSNWKELDETIDFLRPFGNELSLLQCTTDYPTIAGQWGLNQITEMKKRYGLTTGFSDHSGKSFVGIAAAAMGAEILEFHVVFDKQMFGPDAKSSLTIDEVRYLVQSIRELENDRIAGYDKANSDKYLTLKTMFGKSLAVNKSLKIGHILAVNDLESKKPGDKGISAKEFTKIIGKQLVREMKQWDFLNYSDISI
jgi:N,N'-diacetyllegionaminate synthase